MSEDILINGTTYPGVSALKMETPSGKSVAFYPDAVLYNSQNLTETQKEQARQNIGAANAALIENSVTIIGVDKYGTKHSYTLFGKEDTPIEATVTVKVKDGMNPCASVGYDTNTYDGAITFKANVGDTVYVSVGRNGSNSFVVNGEVLLLPQFDFGFTYEHTIVSDNVLIEHGQSGLNSSVFIEDAPVYNTCIDDKGNTLKPVFVNNRYWELSGGNLKMPKGYENSFLLFDTPLVNKRIEATFVVRDTGLWADGNRRCGIVFALTDHDGDLNFRYDDYDASYYWAFINDWNCVEVIKMGRYGNWQWLSTQPFDLYHSSSIDVKTGVKLAAEWDNYGHIKIYANGTLVQEVFDSNTPLTGNYYGLLVNNYGNFNPAYSPYDSPVTSFIAGVE